MLLGFVLGPMLEENLRRALLISRGDPSVFITRPISLAFVIATALIVLTMAVPAVRKRQTKFTG
jgi:TctA family transporter